MSGWFESIPESAIWLLARELLILKNTYATGMIMKNSMMNGITANIQSDHLVSQNENPNPIEPRGNAGDRGLIGECDEYLEN